MAPSPIQQSYYAPHRFDVSQLIGVSVRTLHKWEQPTSNPSGAGKALLKIAATHPQAVREALCSA